MLRPLVLDMKAGFCQGPDFRDARTDYTSNGLVSGSFILGT